MSKKVAATEIIIFGAAVFMNAELSHFTWWAVLSLLASDVAIVLGLHSDRANVLAATVSACVSITVMFFSTQQCGMFNKALTAYGPVTYTLGNFALHYWPSLRLVPRAVSTPRSWKYGDAACLITLYTLTQQPGHVYKCSDRIPHAGFVIASIVGSVAIELILSY